jgi:hypothetical protein
MVARPIILFAVLPACLCDRTFRFDVAACGPIIRPQAGPPGSCGVARLTAENAPLLKAVDILKIGSTGKVPAVN